MRALLFVLLAISACATNHLVTPPTGEGTEYPCGYRFRQCEVSNLCCPDDADCPGTYSCPATMADGPHCCGHVDMPATPRVLRVPPR